MYSFVGKRPSALIRRMRRLQCGIVCVSGWRGNGSGIFKATPRNSRRLSSGKPFAIDRTTFCIFSAKLHKSPTSVACCNKIHYCLLSKNSFRIGLFDEKSDVQRAAGGAQSELCGVALNRSEGFETSPVVIIWKIAVRIIRAMAIMARFFPLRLEICSYFKR